MPCLTGSDFCILFSVLLHALNCMPHSNEKPPSPSASPPGKGGRGQVAGGAGGGPREGRQRGMGVDMDPTRCKYVLKLVTTIEIESGANVWPGMEHFSMQKTKTFAPSARNPSPRNLGFRHGT